MLPKLLIVDDEPAYCASMSRYLSRAGFDVSDAGSLRAARATLASDRYEGVLLDLQLPDGDGIDWIDEIRQTYAEMAVVVVTGRGDIPVAVEAMRRGADHFVTKPIEPAEVASQVRRFIEYREERPSARRRKTDAATPFFGGSAAARELRDAGELAASTDSVVLITGETGSGKGVLARWIHERSSRRAKAFVEVNCSTLRGELLANEMFGHARGAYTSAAETQAGLLDTADGGTLFLDEIGDMDPAIQAQFLKTLEEKCYRRLGDVVTRRSDFRLICATNHSLQDDVSAGRFRRDLFYRLNVLPIRVPALRERMADVPLLARHLASQLAGSPLIDDDAIAALQACQWPGNVRELRNVLERAALLARGSNRILRQHVVDLERLAAPDLGGEDVAAAIVRHGGDKESAARELGISRATLYRRLQKR